ncbi:MAG TPA: hypothetical protein VLM39_11945 [Ignavibacteriaceae bacterium]|nr:hypothetical protein [Ignavibacteriaceae bacterium]
MKRKNKTLLILIIIFVIITALGGIYTIGIQGKQLNEKEEKLAQLRQKYSSIEMLNVQLKEVEEKVTIVDSLLFSGKFTIPKKIPQSRFFNFIDAYSRDYSLYTFTNTEFVNTGAENGFNYYTYKVSGTGAFENVYGLIYAIEHSKELKKIQMADLNSTTSVDPRGIPRYLVKFTLEVRVYYSASDQYAASNFTENNLYTGDLYNAFFPLVRSEIRPNVNNLPDIQEGTLTSLVPQGAFVSDSKGNTILLKKGDQVYLGYLADIDYNNETITFILNKGGIIEYLTLEIGKKHKKEGQ